jgi:hypothetical protein
MNYFIDYEVLVVETQTERLEVKLDIHNDLLLSEELIVIQNDDNPNELAFVVEDSNKLKKVKLKVGSETTDPSVLSLIKQHVGYILGSVDSVKPVATGRDIVILKDNNSNSIVVTTHAEELIMRVAR